MYAEKKVLLRVRNTFSPKADIAEVDAFIREQKVPGQLIVSYPGNAGRSSVDFIEKERVLDTDSEKF